MFTPLLWRWANIKWDTMKSLTISIQWIVQSPESRWDDRHGSGVSGSWRGAVFLLMVSLSPSQQGLGLRLYRHEGQHQCLCYPFLCHVDALKGWGFSFDCIQQHIQGQTQQPSLKPLRDFVNSSNDFQGLNVAFIQLFFTNCKTNSSASQSIQLVSFIQDCHRTHHHSWNGCIQTKLRSTFAVHNIMSFYL